MRTDSLEERDTIKVGIKRNCCFFSLDDRKYLCRIKNKNLFTSAKVILDAQGKIKYYTDIVSSKNFDNNKDICGKYAIFNDESKIATAYIKKDICVKENQRLLSIPKISNLFINFSSNETYTAIRLKNNGFVIKKEDNIILKISPFSILKPQIMTVFNHEDVYLMASFYCLVKYIIKDEFIYLV